MSDVAIDPSDIFVEPQAAGLDQGLTDRIRSYVISNMPINQVPQAFQAVVALGRGVGRGVVDAGAFAQVVLDVYGDTVDAAQAAPVGPVTAEFAFSVGSAGSDGRYGVVAGSADEALGLPPEHYRWWAEPGGGQWIGSGRTEFVRPGVYRLHHAVSLGTVTERTWQYLTVPDGMPVLTRIEPRNAVRGSPEFTLHLYGGGFDPAAEVIWNGGAETTTFIDQGHLTIEVDPSTAVEPGFSVPVWVRNGPGLDSARIIFALVGAGQEDRPPTIHEGA